MVKLFPSLAPSSPFVVVKFNFQFILLFVHRFSFRIVVRFASRWIWMRTAFGSFGAFVRWYFNFENFILSFHRITSLRIEYNILFFLPHFFPAFFQSIFFLNLLILIFVILFLFFVVSFHPFYGFASSHTTTGGLGDSDCWIGRRIDSSERETESSELKKQQKNDMSFLP